MVPWMGSRTIFFCYARSKSLPHIGWKVVEAIEERFKINVAVAVSVVDVDCSSVRVVYYGDVKFYC